MATGADDQAGRFASQIDTPGFLAWVLGLPTGEVPFGGWLNTRNIPFPGDPDRTGDTVARFDDPTASGPPWAVAVEFQSRPDPDMFGRLLVYLGGLWLGLRPDPERGSRFRVGALVVNLTGTGAASRRMVWEPVGLVTEVRVVERNLEVERAEDVPAAVGAGRLSRAVLPWVPLMAGADRAEVIDEWKRLAEAEPDLRHRSDFGGLARLFAERAGRKLIWDAKLEGWSVEESTTVNAWIAQGEARGEERGSTEEARRLVLRLGAKRFSAPAPAATEAAIRAVTDRDRLERLAERVLDAGTWDELLATP
jgi:hypothetical protein